MVDRMNHDWSLFDAYRRMNVEDQECDNDFAPGNEMLSVWQNAKNHYLAKLFPEGQLIIERPIRYEKGTDEMRRDISDLVEAQREFIYKFKDRFVEAIDHNGAYNSCNWRMLSEEDQNTIEVVRHVMDWFSFDSLLQNEINFGWSFRSRFGTRYELDVLGHKLMIQPGMKVMKCIGKVAGWLDLASEFEQFRIAQSQATNQKYISGTACLSIHPMDYATASDNDNGWSSCMSWQEHGCYRMGTVEMMNSPMVLVSYIKSDKQYMQFDKERWNSKKWRAWIIVTPQVLMMNRQYPYHADSIGDFMIKWVRELVEQNLNWHYEDEIYHNLIEELDNRMTNIHFETNFMYNDVSDDDIGVITTDQDVKSHWKEYINFSGHAQCMWCGDIIDYNDNSEDADTLGCKGCHPYVCECCGREIDEEEVWRGPDGECWCDECYADHCFTCDECGEQDYVENRMRIYLPRNTMLARKTFDDMKAASNEDNPLMRDMTSAWDGEFSAPYVQNISICGDCFAKYRDKIHLIKAKDVSRKWGTWHRWEHAGWTDEDEWIIDPRTSDFDTAMKLLGHDTYRRYVIDDRPFHGKYYSELIRNYFKAQWDLLAESLVDNDKHADDPTYVWELVG